MMKKEDLDFSIIILTYNPNLEKLKKTIISSTIQKNISFEIIISDDGSHYDFKKELNEWIVENRINNVIFNFLEKNVGTVNNIIKATDISRGKYIKTISPGDYFYSEDVLEKNKKVLETEDADIVYADVAFYNDNGIVMRKNISHNRIIYSKRYLKDEFCLYGGYFLGMSYTAKKVIYNEILKRFENKVRLMEDRAIIYSAFIENKRIIGIKETLYWYEYGTGVSTSSKRNIMLEKDEEEIFNVISSIYQNDHYAKRMISKYNAKNYSKIKKMFYYLVFYPGYFKHLILRIIFGYIKQNSHIEEMNKITMLIKG